MACRPWRLVMAVYTVCLVWLGYQYVPTSTPKAIASWLNYQQIQDIPTPLTEEWTKEAMAHRGRTLRERCDMIHGDKSGIPVRIHPYMFVDDDHKFLICINNKVGSTTILGILLYLKGVTKTSPLDMSNNYILSHHKYLKRLSQFTNKEIAFRLSNYKKYTFVREPFERLISAYNDKFKYGNESIFREKMAHVIFNRIKPHGSVFVKGYNLSFSEFIQFILHPKTIKEGYDQHWKTYTSTCNPCNIRYDGVGKIETYNKDMDVLLGEIGETGVPVPQIKANPNKSATYLEQYYRGISSENIQQLKNVYANDSFLFDYEFPSVLQMLLNKP